MMNLFVPLCISTPTSSSKVCRFKVITELSAKKMKMNSLLVWTWTMEKGNSLSKLWMIRPDVFNKYMVHLQQSVTKNSAHVCYCC